MKPDMWTIDTVQSLLPAFTALLKVRSVQMKTDDIKVLLDNDSNINDIVIDAHLFTTATIAPS